VLDNWDLSMHRSRDFSIPTTSQTFMPSEMNIFTIANVIKCLKATYFVSLENDYYYYNDDDDDDNNNNNNNNSVLVCEPRERL
jgi:hypothetical protein